MDNLGCQNSIVLISFKSIDLHLSISSRHAITCWKLALISAHYLIEIHDITATAFVTTHTRTCTRTRKRNAAKLVVPSTYLLVRYLLLE